MSRGFRHETYRSPSKRKPLAGCGKRKADRFKSLLRLNLAQDDPSFAIGYIRDSGTVKAPGSRFAAAKRCVDRSIREARSTLTVSASRSRAQAPLDYFLCANTQNAGPF